MGAKRPKKGKKKKVKKLIRPKVWGGGESGKQTPRGPLKVHKRGKNQQEEQGGGYWEKKKITRI